MTSSSFPRLAQAALQVADLDRAKTFYGEQIGLVHLFDAPPALSFFQCGDTRLMLSATPGEEGGTMLYYGVEDVAATCRKIESRGGAVVEPARQIAELDGKPIHLAILDDGVGNRFGLISG
ncbi:MAG: glyoxalase [Alphaproteobacteria bacterium]|nr:glyoxalase [Alphaproteobacteria bacterium]